MAQQGIAFAGREVPSSDPQGVAVAAMKNRRPPVSRAQRLALALALLLLLVVTASLLLVSSGAIPHILYKGSSISLVELNAIHARGEATFCVQQASPLAHVIGMSFEYQCFDSEADADQNMHEVEAHLQAPQPPLMRRHAHVHWRGFSKRGLRGESYELRDEADREFHS